MCNTHARSLMQQLSEFYKVRCHLEGHKQDVKCVVSSEDGNFMATISRDKTCSYWTLDDNLQYFCYHTFSTGDKHPLTAKYFPSASYIGTESVIIGGMTNTLTLHSTVDGSVITTLIGHTEPVSCIELVEDKIISGSWDCTVKEWNTNGALTRTCTQHTAAVWCICRMGRDYLTGAADSLIVRWVEGYPNRTYYGHEQPVRCIVKVANSQFLSCSNDSSIRLWDVDTGDVIRTFSSHNHFVYSLALFRNRSEGELSFVSSGEEKVVKVWRQGKLDNDIVLPEGTIWCVHVLPNNDVVVASSSSIVTIFTLDPERFAPPAIQSAFQERLKSKKRNAFDSIDIRMLKTVEEGTSQKGSTHGQTTLFRKEEQILVYSWNADSDTWNYVGNALRELNEEEQSCEKSKCGGVGYDYVIDVEMDDGKMYKLPYNNGEDPRDAAARFLDNNNLAHSFTSQIINFLVENIPSAKNYASQSYTNPAPSSIESQKLDALFPMKKFITFGQTNVNGLLQRLREIKYSQDDSAFSIVSKYIVDSTKQTEFDFDAANFPWSYMDNIFSQTEGALLVSVLDSIKQLVLIQEFFKVFFMEKRNFYAFDVVSFFANFSTPQMETKCRILAFRTLCNAFIHEKCHKLILESINTIFDALESSEIASTAALHLSFSSLAYNCSVLLARQPGFTPNSEKLLNIVCSVVSSTMQATSNEALCRLFSALCNLLHRPETRINKSTRGALLLVSNISVPATINSPRFSELFGFFCRRTTSLTNQKI